MWFFGWTGLLTKLYQVNYFSTYRRHKLTFISCQNLAHRPPSEDVARTTATDLPLKSNGQQAYQTVSRHRDPSLQTIQLLDTLWFLRLLLAAKPAVMHCVFIIDGRISTQPGWKIMIMYSRGTIEEGVNFVEPHRSTNNSYWLHTNDNDNGDRMMKNDIDLSRHCKVKDQVKEFWRIMHQCWHPSAENIAVVEPESNLGRCNEMNYGSLQD